MVNAAGRGDEASKVATTPNPTAHPHRGDSADRWPIRATWLLFALVATMIGFSVAPVVNDQVGRLNKDYVLWFATGRAVASGLPVYPEDGRVFPFMYPPSAAAMLAILSRLGSSAFLVVLLLLNSLAWFASIALSLYLGFGAGRSPPPAALPGAFAGGGGVYPRLLPPGSAEPGAPGLHAGGLGLLGGAASEPGGSVGGPGGGGQGVPGPGDRLPDLPAVRAGDRGAGVDPDAAGPGPADAVSRG